MSTGSGTGTPLSSASTLYMTVAEFKTVSSIDDTDDDALIAQVLEATSRLIDRYCGRRFYLPDDDETRYYSPERSDLVFTDDIVEITTLKTDAAGDRTFETTWATTDYDLIPRNAALDGNPYRHIGRSRIGTQSFPLVHNGVEIVGRFGYPSVPLDIKMACQIQATRLFKRKDAPFGVIGSAEMGQLLVLSKLDPDVQLLLRPFKKIEV